MEENPVRSAHLVGVCGAGMKALAELLLERNWSVTGSDLSPAGPSLLKLIERGLVFHQGHHRSNVPPTTSSLVYSAAVPRENPERQEATRCQIPQFSYSQMVGDLIHHATGVCLAGTHGKSTTTAMTAVTLDAANRLAAAVVGAELCDGGRSGWNGAGDLFVAESCEYKQSFWDFRPKYAAILNVERDHFDCYPDSDSLFKAFRDFAGRIADDGVLLVNDDCRVSREVASAASTRAKRVTFGCSQTADWRAIEVALSAHGIRFGLCHHEKLLGIIHSPLHGPHNVSNALAAAAICGEVGVAFDVIQQSLAAFAGIRRRFQLLETHNQITLIDDYAHHPTAVSTTLNTARELVGPRRILCIFQPHQIRRTLELFDEFAASFSSVDEVLLAPIFAARESNADESLRIIQNLAKRIHTNGVRARAFASLDQIVTTLEDEVRPGDVIVTMGAGDIDRIHHELTRRL